MRLGLSSWSFPYAIGNPANERPNAPLSAVGLALKAAELGAEVLQIADNLPITSASADELRTVRSICDADSIALELGTAGLEENNLLEHLRLAETMGAKLVRTLPHRAADVPTLAEAQARLAKVIGSFERAGVVLGIENHDHYSSAWMRALVGGCGSKSVGICLDAVNNLGVGESFREVLAALGDLTVNFHCKDYVIRRKPSMLGFDVVGAPAGEGFLDLELAAQRLPADISWIVESWLPWQGDLASTLQMEELWAERGLRNLRTFRDSRASCRVEAGASHEH